MKKVKVLMSLILIAIMLVSGAFEKNVYADDTQTEYVCFTVQKTWENDLEKERPDSVEITIVGTAGEEQVVKETKTISAADGWKKEFKYPAKSGTTQIVYSVYEAPLEKYESSATEDKPLEIKNYKTVVENEHTGEGYKVQETGLDMVPEGNIDILEDLEMDKAEIVYSNPDNFDVGDYYVYVTDGRKSSVEPRMVYNGSLKKGPNNIGDITLTWRDMAKSNTTGETYDVRIKLSDVVIYSLIDVDNSESVKRYVAILSNQQDKLHMQAYSGGMYDANNLKKSIVGVSADVEITVLDNGAPVDGEVRMYMQDLDIADYAAAVNNGAVTSTDTSGKANYYGLDYSKPLTYEGKEYRFVESVEVTGGVVSDIYVSNKSTEKTILAYKDTENGIIFAPTSRPSESATARKSLKYLANTNGTSFTWRGSNCGTALIADGSDDVPVDTVNTVINTSSLYKIEYYYQVFGEEGAYYKETPDDSTDLVMVAPGTKVVVSDDKDKVPQKEDYVLDETMKEDWEGTTSADPNENPLVLKVYFKKVLRVIYHDNVKDTVFEQQKNMNLDYLTPTPKFDTDPKTEGIQEGDPTREGYSFLGWSEEPGSDVIEIPAAVTKNADYWAHWKPAINKYIVEYYYEVNGKYPTEPDFKSENRIAYTEDKVEIIPGDKTPQKKNYKLNDKMTAEWTGVVLPDGSLALKVYFKKVSAPSTQPSSPVYIPPVTGIE